VTDTLAYYGTEFITFYATSHRFYSQILVKTYQRQTLQLILSQHHTPRLAHKCDKHSNFAIVKNLLPLFHKTQVLLSNISRSVAETNTPAYFVTRSDSSSYPQMLNSGGSDRHSSLLWYIIYYLLCNKPQVLLTNISQNVPETNTLAYYVTTPYS
jgi:hypothetical protein